MIPLLPLLLRCPLILQHPNIASLSLHILSREHFRPVELENLIGIILRYVEAKLGGKRRLEVVLLVEARRVLRDS